MNIAFWSFKGGSGRSICLANLAVKLGMTKRVGLIDFDLEAPGLHTIFGISDEDVSKKGCLTDCFRSNSATNLENYIWKVKDGQKWPDEKERNIFLLPNINDPTALDKTDFQSDEIVLLIEEIFNKMKSIYTLDYILIDARSGFSAHSGIAFQFMSEAFLFFRPNIQHRDGLHRALKIICDIQGLDYKIIATQVPDIPEATKFLNDTETILGKKINYLLPLDPEFSIGEKLLFGDTCKKISEILDEMAKNILGDVT
ncbi:MAG: P-loop NTPase [Candidatus Scalindua sediminis]|nr:P-loop NTPase [Candidatus Scalindua sediminis]